MEESETRQGEYEMVTHSTLRRPQIQQFRTMKGGGMMIIVEYDRSYI